MPLRGLAWPTDHVDQASLGLVTPDSLQSSATMVASEHATPSMLCSILVQRQRVDQLGRPGMRFQFLQDTLKFKRDLSILEMRH